MRTATLMLLVTAGLVGCANGQQGKSEADMDKWLGSSPSRTFVQPPNARFATPVAVDHVAVMEIDRKTDGGGRDELTVARSGRWLREDLSEKGKRSTTVSDLSSGISFHFTRAGDQYQSLMVWLPEQRGAVTLSRTDQTDQVLGEKCSIWKYIRQSVTLDYCITQDGIVLWQRHRSERGDDLGSSRAVSITRRHIDRDEAEIPENLLQWESWFDGYTPANILTPNDEVIMKSEIPGEVSLMRRLGDDLVSDETNKSGRSVNFRNHRFILSFHSNADGTPRIFSLSRRSAVAKRSGAMATQSGARRTILGYQCEMLDAAPGVSDLSRHECRTKDGMVLARETWSWGSGSRWTAVSLRKGGVAERDMLPPKNLFGLSDWATTYAHAAAERNPK